jgi:F-type H+-transporting ATPase subunit a
MFNSLFATELHVSLKAERVFDVGPLHVTNSMIYGVICSIFIVWFMSRAAKLITVRPKKGLFRNAIEYIVEFILNLLESPFGSRENAARFAPYFGVYFIFIFFSNVLELVPWVGDGLYLQHQGVRDALLRPFTADLNGTIAMAVVAIVMVQVLSIKEQGAKNHLKHYFGDKPLNPINGFIGILEVFGEFTRIMSLSLRLFLNTAVGEILVVVFTSMILAEGRTPFAVIPIFAFEGLVAFIQAYVFTVLAGTYLGLAIAHAPDSHDDHHSTNTPEAVETGGTHDG